MHPFVITIAQQKGGSGKSTLAANIACALSSFGLKVALIDTDPQQTISFWKQKRDKNSNIVANSLEITNTTGWKVSNEIARLSKFEAIIIDSPPHMETETKSSIRAANIVVVPCQPSPTDLWATDKTLEIIAKENKKMILVFNRCPHNSKLVKTIEKSFEENIERFFLGNRVVFATSMLQGLSVIETDPDSSAAEEILQITKYLYNAIKN